MGDRTAEKIVEKEELAMKAKI